jgi:acyl-CoA thioesterase-2
MGNLAKDTAVHQTDATSFRANICADWEIWGPMGGYVASIALRAVGELSPFLRPASFFCSYLGVASFEEVDILVSQLRSARTAAAHRVQITQGGKPILEASTWSIGNVDGLEHNLTEAPGVPAPEELKTLPELLAEEGKDPGVPYPFWNNFESRPIAFHRQWPPTQPLPPLWRQWCRFQPESTFADPWVDACRSLILIDVQS